MFNGALVNGAISVAGNGTSDESYYNVRGERIAIAQHSQYSGGTVADTVRVFAYDGNGQIISRRDGTASGNAIDQGSDPSLRNQHYVYVNGQQVAHYDEKNTLDVLSQVTAFSNGNGTGDYVVQEGDTLKSIAQAVYGNASLWYIVAQANALGGDADLAVGLSLSIPAVTTSKNDSTTFKPYNPSEIQGSTTPNLPVIAPPPPPPKQHCNVVAAIVVIAVTAVVSYYAGPVAGNIAGQLAGDLMGTHHGINLAETAVAIVSEGVGQYVSEVSTAAGASATVAGAASAASSYAASVAASKALNQPTHFSFAGLVANAAGGAAAANVGPLIGEQVSGSAEAPPLTSAASYFVQGAVTREVSEGLGDNHVQSWQDILGGALGAGIGAKLRDDIADYRLASVKSSSDIFLARQSQRISDQIEGNNESVLSRDGQMPDLSDPASFITEPASSNTAASGYLEQGRPYESGPFINWDVTDAIRDKYGPDAGFVAGGSDRAGYGFNLPSSLISPNGYPFVGFYDPGHGQTSTVGMYDARSQPFRALDEDASAGLDYYLGDGRSEFTGSVTFTDQGAIASGPGSIPLLPDHPVGPQDTGLSWDPSDPSMLDRTWQTFTKGAATTSGVGAGAVKSIIKGGYGLVEAGVHLSLNGYAYAARALGSTDPGNAKRAQAFVTGADGLSRAASNFAQDPYGITGRALASFGQNVADAWQRSTSSNDVFDRFVGGLDLGEQVTDAGQLIAGGYGLARAGVNGVRLLEEGVTNLTLARTAGLTGSDLLAGGVLTAGDVTMAVADAAGRFASSGATMVGDAVVNGLRATSAVIAGSLNVVGDVASGGIRAAGGYVVDTYNGAVNAVNRGVDIIRNTSFATVGDAWYLQTPGGSMYRFQGIVGTNVISSGVPLPTRLPFVKVLAGPTKAPIRLNDVVTYGESAARSIVGDGLTGDHIPSLAAIKTHVEGVLGQPLTRAQLRVLRNNTNTVVIGQDLHEAGRTYLGANTPLQVIGDSLDLRGAALLDQAAHLGNARSLGYSDRDLADAFRRLDSQNEALFKRLSTYDGIIDFFDAKGF